MRGSRWVRCRPILSGEACRFGEFGNLNLWFPNSCSVRRQQANFGGGLGERSAGPTGHLLPRILSSGHALFKPLPQPARVGSADRKFPENLREFADFGRFNLWRPIVVARTDGSKCVQAQPAGSADRKFPENLREFADFGRFNLWRPIVVARTGGSKWQSAQPTGSKWQSAQPTGSRWVQAQRWTRPEALPDMSFLTSSRVTRLKSPSMVCLSAEAAAAKLMASSSE